MPEAVGGPELAPDKRNVRGAHGCAHQSERAPAAPAPIELDVEVVVRDLLLETSHEYPERAVTLFFYRCDLIGTPRAVIGQEMAWVARSELPSLNFPPADDELIRRLIDRRGGP